MVNRFISVLFLFGVISISRPESINLPDLEPQDAQQIIEQQDTSLKYAPKVESNVPAVRYLGNEPHNVVEDIYLANQYHGQDGLGGYLYGYSVPDIAKTEKKKAGGDLRGAYNYITNGREIKVEYWDDGTGFHQIDNVPKNLPEDLPAVKAEKERFLKRWQEEAERNSRPVEDPYNSEGQYKEGPLSVQGQLQRQQQFAAQFGKAAAYKQPEGAASQQSAIYQSNLEKASQPYNANYQPYQGKDQQNQGAYQTKHSSAYTAAPANTGYGQTSGGYGATGSTGYGGQSSGAYGQGQGSSGYGGSAGYGGASGGSSGYGGKPSGGASGYGVQTPASSSGYGGAVGYGGQSTSTSPAYGGAGAYGGQPSAGYGVKPAGGASAYGGQSSGGSGAYGGSGGYGGKPASGSSGYGGQSSGGSGGYGGQSSGGYGGQSSGGYGGQTSGGYGGQSSGAYGGSGGSSGYGQSTGYLGQPSQNVNKYAPASSGYGQTHSKYISSPGQEDDGSYKPEKDEEQGPPKGFFYKFDYPVGIIVSKPGSTQGGTYGQGGYQDHQKTHGSY